MNRDEKINSLGLFCVIVALSGSSFYGVYSSYLINKTGNDSIISMIVGFVISLLFSKIIFDFFNFDNSSYNDKVNKCYGKVSIFIKIIVILISIFLYILFTYRLCAFLSNQYLLDKPKILIQFIICVLTFYVASNGFETIVRVSVISFFVGLFLVTFDILFLANEVKLMNYLPIGVSNILDIVKPAVIYAMYFSAPIFFINFISKKNIVDKNNLKKYYYLAVCLSFFITFACLVTTIGVLGSETASIFDYPLYTVLKKISIFDFVDSLENVSTMIWFLYLINTSVVILNFITTLIRDTFKLSLRGSKIINYFIFILTIILPIYLFSNNNYVESFSYLMLPFILMSVLIIISMKKTK